MHLLPENINVEYNAMVFNRKFLLLFFATIVLVTATIGLVVSPWSSQATESFTFPTGYGQEVIIVSCSTDNDASLLNEVAVQAFESFETGIASISKDSAHLMQETMLAANANNSLPDFSEIEADGLEMRRELLDAIHEQYECEIRRRAT
jgi:hypothetical protein